MVRHLVFFEAMQDGESPAGKAAVAGLVVLRLVDDWLMIGSHTVTTDITQQRAIREAIAAVSAGSPIRSILTGIVDTIMQAERADIGLVAPKLLAYGTALTYDSRWTIAIDVFQFVYTWTHRIRRYTAFALDATLYTAAAYRNSGNTVEAEKHYTLLKRQAGRVRDEGKRLLAELGLAKLLAMRGDLPAAEVKHSELHDAAQRAGLPDIEAFILQGRAHLAAQREQYDVAIPYAYQALQLTNDSRSRDRLLNDIAVMFMDRGSWQVAQDAFLVVAATAQELFSRLFARVCLLYIAALAGRHQEFESYRDELQDADMPPDLRADFYIYLGKGYARFGNMDDARKTLQMGVDVATKHNLNYLVFLAEKASVEIETVVGKTPMRPVPTSVDIQEAVIAITNLYGLAFSKL